jgi:NAD(P)-dependent dehydrogenase (short-subunit alcohol dehydrogenase family)
MRLKDKVAIVTGAAGGIGRAHVHALAREGASMVVDDINLEGAETIADEARKLGAKAFAIKADVSKEDEVKRMVERTIAEFGRVDVMVNNAAYLGLSYKLFHETEVAEWDAGWSTTVKGVLHCCRAVIPRMIEQRVGRIINISSAVTMGGMERMTIYTACKGAVVTFSRSLAVELGPHGITVNCVSPGNTGTPGMLALLEMLPDELKQWHLAVPLQRIAKPEDIANMVVFLASDESGYITGQDIGVNGGSTLPIVSVPLPTTF